MWMPAEKLVLPSGVEFEFSVLNAEGQRYADTSVSKAIVFAGSSQGLKSFRPN